MKTRTALGLAALPFAFLAAPAMAQNAPVNGVLTIYGDDPCPPEQICVRAPESDRYRLPPATRQADPRPSSTSWAVRSEEVVQDNPTGIGSCSTVGPGGATGCFVKEATKARREARQRSEAEKNLPLP